MGSTQQELQHWHDWTSPDFFVAGRHREQRFLSLFLRQILPKAFQKTKLTLTGWVVVLVAMGIGTAAYNAASNILFLTLALILSSLVLSGLLSLINFRKLDWQLLAPTHLRAGEPALAEVELRNAKRIFPSMCLSFRVRGGDAEELLYLAQGLQAGEATRLEWTFSPKRRGKCRVALSGVESRFPFGFLHKSLGADQAEELLVWPGRVEYSFEPEASGLRFPTGATRRIPGPGSDLINLRPYERGDPPRLVHWKATARLGKLMIRQLAQEGEQGFHLCVDTLRDAWRQDQFDLLCALVCSLAEDLYHAGRLESVMIGGADPMAVRAIRDLEDVFDRMALVERGEQPLWQVSGIKVNRITFRPNGEEGVFIYVDDQQTGQVEH